MKKKKMIIWGVVIGVVLLFTIIAVSSYNGLVDAREGVESSYSDVSVYLQRRADLIPNLVNSVKGYTDYEQSTLTAVTEARTAFQKANSVNGQIEASNQLETALDVWVNAVTEAYPDLKSNTQFTALMDELSGTENRIATARKDFNDAAREYNSSIKKFPKSILAGMFGFEEFKYFEASAGAESVPQVDFN